MILEFVRRENGEVPKYQTEGSAGMDLHSSEKVVMKPLERKLIDTGINIKIPEGCEGQVRPRSGMSWKHGITVLNSPGTIDQDYRGPLKVMLINLSDENYEINVGDRIAQLVIAKYEKVSTLEKKELSTSERGDGGFGSTGR